MNNKSTILKFAKVFLVLDLCLIIFSLTLFNANWLLNTQVAFVSSMFITIASFLSYKRNVSSRLSKYDEKLKVQGYDRDKVDEIDDPFDLYSEDVEPVPEEELTPEKIKEIIQDEKKKVKKNSFKNTVFSAGGFVSIYRLLGYGILIFGFFALNNNKLFEPIAFLVGLGVVPIGTLLAKFVFKANLESKEDQ